LSQENYGERYTSYSKESLNPEKFTHDDPFIMNSNSILAKSNQRTSFRQTEIKSPAAKDSRL